MYKLMVLLWSVSESHFGLLRRWKVEEVLHSIPQLIFKYIICQSSNL